MLRPPSLRLNLAALALLGIVFAALYVRDTRSAAPDGAIHVLLPPLPGDGALLLLPDDRSVLIDGSADGAALATWLGNSLPFGQRHIDVLALTRPAADTLPGQIAALRRYAVGQALAPASERSSSSFDAWHEALAADSAPVHALQAGDQLQLGSCALDIPAVVDGRAALALRCGSQAVVWLQSLDDDPGAALSDAALPVGAIVVYPWQRKVDTELLTSLQPSAIVFGEASGDETTLSWQARRVGGASLYHEAG